MGQLLSCLPLLAADSLLGLGLALAATGLAIPPILVLSSVITETAVHRTALTQAFTWLNSASAAGSAGAAAISGRAVDTFGAHGGFAIAAAATSAMAVLATANTRAAGGRRPNSEIPTKGLPSPERAPEGTPPRGQRRSPNSEE
jgi:predicted MFS family arabinose efflux permease